MEAVMMHGSFDQSISPYKSHLKYPKINHQNHPIISNPADSFWPSYFNSTGLLQPPLPPCLSQSYPSYLHQHSPQPPLLPLPTATPRRSAAARGLSCPPANNKTSNPNRSREPFHTSKKSKSPKKEEKKSTKKVVGIIDSDARKCDQFDMFSGTAIFTMSPLPSSLPLPTFALRPKLGYKAEAAAGVDAGATDDLRRLLRLQ